MRENKEAILMTNRRVGRLFQMAYFGLKEAKAIQEEWESYTSEAMNWGLVNEATLLIADELFSGVTPMFSTKARVRHLFASAITPEGSMNYLDTVLQDVKKLFVIKGEPGTGKATLIGNMANQARLLGLEIEAYHCSFVPQNIDVVVLPELEAAVANLTDPVTFDPNCLKNLTSCKEIDLSAFMNQDITSGYAEEINSCKRRFDAAFHRAVNFLSRAKAEHDVMEAYYIPAMDFDAINATKEKILARVLRYARETEYTR